MRGFTILVTLSAVVALPAAAQSLAEAAAAAAGGSAAGVAGKRVSDALDNVFGKVAKTTDKAAEDKDVSKAKGKSNLKKGAREPEGGPSSLFSFPASAPPAAAPAVELPAAPKPAVSGKVVARRPQSTPRQAASPDVVTPAVAPAEAAPAVAAPPPVTVEDLSRLEAGASRNDVLSRLGKPSSRLSMADEGKLVEVYSYRSLGSVRLIDGAVSEVRPSRAN